mgnify:CR=1 FL=1
MLVIVVLGWRLGGWRLALLVAVLGFFAAASGLWIPAMQTLYLCGASALVACLLGEGQRSLAELARLAPAR